MPRKKFRLVNDSEVVVTVQGMVRRSERDRITARDGSARVARVVEPRSRLRSFGIEKLP